MAQNQSYIQVIRMAQYIGVGLLLAALVTEIYLVID
jgi:hypothetical protein